MSHDTDKVTTPVILFDGGCGLCHRSVRFVLRREKDRVLKFASLDSPYATAELAKRGTPLPPAGTVVLIDGDRVFLRSDAALRIAGHLRAPWSWLLIFLVLPRGLRDALYDFVARRRHRWFAKPDEACPMPGPATKGRFLS